MKRAMTLALALMLLVLTACGGQTELSPKDSQSTGTQEQYLNTYVNKDPSTLD